MAGMTVPYGPPGGQPPGYPQPGQQPGGYQQPGPPPPGYPQPGGFAQPAGHPQPGGFSQPGGSSQPAGFPQPGGAPQPGGFAPPGRLVVDASYSPMAFLLAVTGPKIEINGQPITANWGQWPIDLPAGQYNVRVSTRYLGEMGPAQLGVTVYPGQQTTVYYRTPAMMFMAGAIGFTPQPTRGMAAVLALTAVSVLLFFVVILATVLG
jgi:hypothetical protein